MIKAVLLDLDDTLIHNPTQQFLDSYLTRLDHYFHEVWGTANLSRHLRHGVQAVMRGPRDMTTRNITLLTQTISTHSGHSVADVQTALHDFFRGPYDDVAACVQPVSAAPRLLAALRARGVMLVIATNPIYPREAIHKRMQWGQLPADLDHHYDFVTHAENMHFAKPQPEYYAEILARIGVEPDEALMVGNDPTNDIIPARQIGIHTLHIDSQGLETALPAITALGDSRRRALVPEMIAPQLRGNVAALNGIAAEVRDPDHWTHHPDPDEWSPLQIICHLLTKEDQDQRPRLLHVQTEDNPFLRHVPPPGPADMPHCAEDGLAAVQRFAKSRQRTLEIIAQIPPDDWKRPARHSIFGPTTLLEMAHFTAQHDRLHIKQLCQTLGKCG